MATWSGIRKKLETEYLAESLRGHLQYFAASYSRSPDHVGRAAIYLDGKPVISGNYYNYWFRANELPESERFGKAVDCCTPTKYELELGMFDQRDFYNAFNEFDNQSIEKSLESENLIVRIFAVVDRRIGKRRLKILCDNISEQPDFVKRFIDIRLNAENMVN